MKLINKHKHSEVYYNEETDEFIKLFFPKFSKKIKYFLGLRKYPGHNFKFISKELNKLGIPTAEITACDKYSVTTKNVDGMTIEEYIDGDLNHPVVDEFIEIAVKILTNGIYYGDFSFKNFIIKDKKIYAIDLEDYRKESFFTHSLEYAIPRLKNRLPLPVAKRIEEELKCSE